MYKQKLEIKDMKLTRAHFDALHAFGADQNAHCQLLLRKPINARYKDFAKDVFNKLMAAPGIYTIGHWPEKSLEQNSLKGYISIQSTEFGEQVSTHKLLIVKIEDLIRDALCIQWVQNYPFELIIEGLESLKERAKEHYKDIDLTNADSIEIENVYGDYLFWVTDQMGPLYYGCFDETADSFNNFQNKVAHMFDEIFKLPDNYEI